MAKILIIDDEKDLCLVLSRFLSKHGYEVLEAHKGKKALEIINESVPDLILCDFMLDDMDGTTVLKAIKEINPSTPVIIITGFSNIKTAVEVMRLGAVDYVIKPLIPEEILLTIRKALDRALLPVPDQVSQNATPSGQLLANRGLKIARRTVAKYRDELRIPAAQLRWNTIHHRTAAA